ncbi:hypothetical protein [Bacillus sp. LL01]|uniref:hypothetical protein n=1 Tax=Bacillus sp. LL01 TaxID=1665556 RepID=UPI000AFE71A4|nr:hypothetical protein [Bacillus sp. LL01]
MIEIKDKTYILKSPEGFTQEIGRLFVIHDGIRKKDNNWCGGTFNGSRTGI